MAVRSAAARHPDVVELDLEQVARPAVHRLEPEADRLPRERDPSRSRPSATRRRRRRVPPGDPEDLDLAAVGPLDDRAQRVGRRRRRAVGEDIARTSAAGRRRPAGRSAAIGSSSGRRGRSRVADRAGRRAGHERLRARPRRPQLLRAVARRRCRVGPDEPAARVAVSVPSGSTIQPRATSRSSSKAPQRAVRTAAPRTASGHPARSIRYRTASLFRPVSEAIIESSG